MEFSVHQLKGKKSEVVEFIIFYYFYIKKRKQVESRKLKLYSDAELEKWKNKIVLTFEKNKAKAPLEEGLEYLEHAQKANQPKHVAHAHYIIARSQYQTGNFPKAIQYFKSANKIYESIDLKKNMESSLIALGTCESLLGNHDKSIEAYKNALKVESNDIINKACIYNNIGSQYKKAANIETAIKYFQETMKMLNPAIEAHQSLYYQTMSNVAKCHFKLGNIAAAEKEFRYVDEFAQQSSLKYLRANALLGLGKCTKARGDSEKAKVHVSDSMLIAKKNGLKPILIQSNIEFASILIAENNLTSVENLLVDSYSLALSFFPESLKDILQLMIEFYTKTGKHDLAKIFRTEIGKTEPIDAEKLISLIR